MYLYLSIYRPRSSEFLVPFAPFICADFVVVQDNANYIPLHASVNAWKKAIHLAKCSPDVNPIEYMFGICYWARIRPQ